jgi:hypothetical protein
MPVVREEFIEHEVTYLAGQVYASPYIGGTAELRIQARFQGIGEAQAEGILGEGDPRGSWGGRPTMSTQAFSSASLRSIATRQSLAVMLLPQRTTMTAMPGRRGAATERERPERGGGWGGGRAATPAT